MEFLKKETRIDFLGKRNIAFAASGIVLLICLVSILVRGLSFGIDFTGGTLVELAYRDSVDIQQVRDTLAEAGVEDAVVQYFGTSRDVMVRLPATAEGSSAELSSVITESLRGAIPETLTTSPEGGLQQCVSPADNSPRDCAVQMLRVEFVGPQVGEQLTEQGGLAMLYALIGILIYVAWRFQIKFSVGAIAALVHDVLFTVGFFSLTGVEFSLPVLAAVLAVIGYSLNDTVVVFDRVRENLRKQRRGDTVDVMNGALNQTLRRTILTSFTTLLVVVTLLLVGGEAVFGFALALFVGIIVGTYSTVFVACPIVLLLRVTRDDLAPVKKEGAEQADPMP